MLDHLADKHDAVVRGDAVDSVQFLVFVDLVQHILRTQRCLDRSWRLLSCPIRAKYLLNVEVVAMDDLDALFDKVESNLVAFGAGKQETDVVVGQHEI